MPGEVHALARRSLQGLTLPEPIARYRPGLTERINTNPFAGAHGAYPVPGGDALRAAYAWLLTQAGPSACTLDRDNILFTAGSIAGLDLLLRAFCEPFRDAICIQSPTFPCYAQLAVAYDLTVHDVPLAGPSLELIDVDAVARTGAKLTFICAPNNPTGGHVSRDLALEVVRRSSGLVVLDEAYVEFSQRPSLVYDVAAHPNLVVLRTFSKAWGLAALRVGAVVAHPDVVYTLRILQDPYGFHTAAQRAVQDRIEHYAEVEAQVRHIRAERERMARELSACAAVQRLLPSEANFLFVQLRSESAFASFAPDLLLSDMRHVLPRGLRICVGDGPHNERVLAAFRTLDTHSRPLQQAPSHASAATTHGRPT